MSLTLIGLDDRLCTRSFLPPQENVFSERIWKAKVKTVLEKYQKKMVTAIKNGYDGAEESKRWSFAGAFLYSLTVITTIGRFLFLIVHHLYRTVVPSVGPMLRRGDTS